MLLNALRRRMKRQLESENGGATPITQNFYQGGGGGGGMGGGRGMMEGGDMPSDPRDMSYLVDITREDIEPGDTYDTSEGQRTAKRKGWRKIVHRFATPKKKTDLME